MTYDDAIVAITAKLNGIADWEEFSDAPIHPDSAPLEANYIYDDTEVLDSADIVRAATSEATAKATLLLKRSAVGNDNPAKVLRRANQSVKTAMHELSATAPGFTVFVSEVKYSYDMAKATWAAAFLTLTVEAYS